MPRKSYYKPYKRTYGPKAHWASNIVQKDLSYPTVYQELCSNAVQAPNAPPTPIIIKAGNFKIKGDGTASASGAVNVFIMYLPESWGTTETDLNSAVSSHPEWVMGWTTLNISSAAGNDVNAFSITSRLKRNLNSGDRIVLFVQPVGGNKSFTLAFTAQFFTRAN